MTARALKMLKRLTYLARQIVRRGPQRSAPHGAAFLSARVLEQGALDHVVEGVAYGWARNIDDPERLVGVDFYLDDFYLGRALCEGVRSDLVERDGFRRGRCGFVFPLPLSCESGGRALRAFAAQSGLELFGSPWRAHVSASKPDRTNPPIGGRARQLVSPGAVRAVYRDTQEDGYGPRYAALTEVDPNYPATEHPVTRIMGYAGVRSKAKREAPYGRRNLFDLLLASAEDLRTSAYGMPLSIEQISSLALPARSGGHIDLSSFTLHVLGPEASGAESEQGAVRVLSVLVDRLLRLKLPLDLIGERNRAFLSASDKRFGMFLAGLPLVGEAVVGGGGADGDALRAVADVLGLGRLKEPGFGRAPVSAPSPRRRGGVQIVAARPQGSGLDQNAQRSLEALERLGAPTRLDQIAAPALLETGVLPFDDPGYGVMLLHLPPQDALDFLLRLPLRAAPEKIIGFFMWETERSPEDHELALRAVDEIWTGSEFCADAFRSAVPTTPVRVVGHALGAPAPAAAWDARGYAGAGAGDFIFYFHFDARSWITRKNPTASVRAFKQAFANEEKVRLLIKCRHLNLARTDPRWLPWYLELLEEVQDDPRVLVQDDDLDRAQMSALMHACDCFVSLHRSEGFGYGMAEAMQAGKPVIASRYSGNLDFMSEDEAWLVSGYRRKVQPLEFLSSGEGQFWFEPDVGSAARAMLEVYHNKNERNARAARARERVARELSIEVLAGRYLRSLTASGNAPEAAAPASSESPEPRT